MAATSSPVPCPPARSGRVAAIGVFDGVHRGHQAVLDAAGREGRHVTAVTFAPHPRTVFGMEVPLLCAVDRRRELLREHGADEVVVSPFDRAVSRLTPSEWIESALVPLGVDTVVVGAGFRFGRGRAGTCRDIAEAGLRPVSVPLAGGVSSTWIRAAIQRGEVDLARLALGRAPELEIEIVSRSSGSGWWRATAVPRADDLLAPARGTYRALVDGHRCILSVAGDIELISSAPHGPPPWMSSAPGPLRATFVGKSAEVPLPA